MSSSSSRPGTAPETPPEFFVDRDVGRSVTASLRALGWLVTSINDVFPDDAQEVSDAEWLEYGCSHGWAALTRDKAIRYSPQYRQVTTPIFALSSGNLPLAEMVRRFEAHRPRIWSAARTTERQFWVVYEQDVVRRD